MKAWVRTSGEDLNIEIKEVEIPKISENEVLVEMKAFGVGIHDRYFIPQNINFPYVIGTEGSGVIIEIGKEVKEYKIGDRVTFTSVLQEKGGTWAEYCAVKAGALMKIANMAFTEAAAIPIAGDAALESIKALQIKSGDKIFIGGGSGAIGTLVIQLAKKRGASIGASSSTKNHDYMKSLGLDMAVDYSDPDWVNKILDWSNGGVDGALAIIPNIAREVIKVIKNNGKLVTVSGDAESVVTERFIKIEQMNHHPETKVEIISLIKDIEIGEIKLKVEGEYTFEEAGNALIKTETRHAKGKVVVVL